MHLNPKQAHAVLPKVDPGRLYKGCPVGLRDGAVLALIAGGYSAVEIAALRGTNITMTGGHVVITVQRRGFQLSGPLPVDLGARVLAWLTERRLWSTSEKVFTGVLGPLTPRGVRKILNRYCNRRRPTRRLSRRGSRRSQ